MARKTAVQIQETIENNEDFEHYLNLHRDKLICEYISTYPFFRETHQVSPAQGGAEGGIRLLLTKSPSSQASLARPN